MENKAGELEAAERKVLTLPGTRPQPCIRAAGLAPGGGSEENRLSGARQGPLLLERAEQDDIFLFPLRQLVLCQLDMS